MQTLNFEEFLKLDVKPCAVFLEDGPGYHQTVDGMWWKEEGLEGDVLLEDWDPVADEENVRYTTVEDPALIAKLNAVK